MLKDVGDPNDIKKEYLSFTKTLHAANLALCVQQKYEDKSGILKTFAFGLSAAYYWANSQKAFKESDLFFANPNEKILCEVFFD